MFNPEIEHHIIMLENIVRESGESLEGNCMYLHNSFNTHSNLIPKQQNLLRISKSYPKILEIGFNAGHSALLFLHGNPNSTVDIIDDNQHSYTQKCFEYLQSHFPDRLRLVEWGDSQNILPQHVIRVMGKEQYDLFHIDGNTDKEIMRSDVMYCKYISHESSVLIFDDIWIPHLRDLYDEFIRDDYIRPVLCRYWQHTTLYSHQLCGYSKSGIAVLSLHIGEEFRQITRYSLLSKLQYCNRQHYDLIIDETCFDTTRPPAWSKIRLIQKYLSEYKYVVWIDADTLIMNPELKLEEFIEQYSNGRDMLVGYDRDRINTGVWFIRNTEWSHSFLNDVYAQEHFIDNGYWEQAAFIDLWERNWCNAKERIATVWHTAFNSYYYNYEWGHFLIHFPGCRPIAALELAFYKYCPVRKFEDTNESYQRRMYWIQHESQEYEKRKLESNFQVM